MRNVTVFWLNLGCAHAVCCCHCPGPGSTELRCWYGQQSLQPPVTPPTAHYLDTVHVYTILYTCTQYCTHVHNTVQDIPYLIYICTRCPIVNQWSGWLMLENTNCPIYSSNPRSLHPLPKTKLTWAIVVSGTLITDIALHNVICLQPANSKIYRENYLPAQTEFVPLKCHLPCQDVPRPWSLVAESRRTGVIFC